MAEDKMQIFGEKIKKFREIKFPKRTKAAEKLGVLSTTLSSWEGGSSLPPTDMIRNMSRIYGVQLEEFIPYYAAAKEWRENMRHIRGKSGRTIDRTTNPLELFTYG